MGASVNTSTLCRFSATELVYAVSQIVQMEVMKMKPVLSIYIYIVVYICLIIYSEVVCISRVVIACFMIDWTVPVDKFQEILQRFVRRFFCVRVFSWRKGRR